MSEEKSPGVGHNSGLDSDGLNSLIERIERLEEDKAAIQGDIKEIYVEAKARGFNTKVLRQVIRLRKMDQAVLDEEFETLRAYLASVGIEF
jgi:uncharacterized protein (UPF0335 family)